MIHIGIGCQIDFINFRHRTENHDGRGETQLSTLCGHQQNYETAGGQVRRQQGDVHLRES